jgi:hypothetical protein
MHILFDFILELVQSLLLGLMPSREPYRIWFVLAIIFVTVSSLSCAWLGQSR